MCAVSGFIGSSLTKKIRSWCFGSGRNTGLIYQQQPAQSLLIDKCHKIIRYWFQEPWRKEMRMRAHTHPPHMLTHTRTCTHTHAHMFRCPKWRSLRRDWNEPSPVKIWLENISHRKQESGSVSSLRNFLETKGNSEYRRRHAHGRTSPKCRRPCRLHWDG